MIYDDEDDYIENSYKYEEGDDIEYEIEEESKEEGKEEKEKIIFFSNDNNMTNDFDMQGFPVHEAVDFYHNKTKKIRKGTFKMFDSMDFLGDNKFLLDVKTDILGQDLLGLGDIAIKKGKKKIKNTGLIGNNNIFKL